LNSLPPGSSGRRFSVPVLLTAAALVIAAVVAVTLGGCTSPRPSSASLAAEPVLAPFPGEVELAAVRMQPQRGTIGVPSRDGVVERVVAVDLLPGAAADLVQERYGSRYGFRRVDLGEGTPVTVELRGEAPTGAHVIVTATTGSPMPLYGSPDDVQSAPPDRPTTVVVSVISRR